MKQVYIQPTTEIVKSETIEMVCATRYTLNKYTRWGATTNQSDYAVNEWVNEKKDMTTVRGFEATVIEDDYNTLENRAGEGFWE